MIVAGRRRCVPGFELKYAGGQHATSNDPAKISLKPANHLVGVARAVADSGGLTVAKQSIASGRQMAGSRYLLAGLPERSACRP